MTHQFTWVGVLVHFRDFAAALRLDRAYRAFPDSGLLCVALADAALRCGQLDLTERLLKIAETEDLARFDPFGSLKRTRAGFHAKRDGPGDEAIARGLYEELIQERKAPASYLQYGEYLASKESFKRSVEVYQRVIKYHPNIWTYRASFVRAVERWWASLDARGRQDMRHGDPFFVKVYEQYLEGLRIITERGTEPTSQTADLPREVPTPPVR